MTLEELNIKITAETASLRKEIQQVESQMKHLSQNVEQNNKKVEDSFSKLAKAIPWAAIIKGLTDISKAAISAAYDLAEVQNVVDVAFGSSAGKIDNWAKSMKDSFGLSEKSAKEFASTFKTIGDSMGLSNTASSQMATNLTELAADMASFYNADADTTSNALQAIYTGNAQALKQYGIVLSETTLEEFAAANGLKQKYSEMTQAEKVLLRYQYVMKATKNAQGDFARTADSVANQLKLLKENGNELLQQFGNKLEPSVKNLLAAANEMVPVANELIDAVGEVIDAAQPLIDFTIEITKSNLTTVLQTISSILRAMAPVVNTISVSVQPILELVNKLLLLPVELLGELFGGIEALQNKSEVILFNVSNIAQHYQKIDTATAIAVKNLEQQVKASQKLLTIVSGFDEINVLNKKDDDSVLGNIASDSSVEAIKTVDDYIKDWVYWQNRAEEAQKALNDYYQQGADKLGITREQFQKLWNAYSNKDFTSYYQLLGEFELDTSKADEVMKAFDDQCGLIVNGLQSDLDNARYNTSLLVAALNAADLTMDQIQQKAAEMGYQPIDTNPSTPSSSASDPLSAANAAEMLARNQEERKKNTENFFTRLWNWFTSLWSVSPNGYDGKMYASGGVLTSPTFGLMGEYAGAQYNPEIVTPQNIMRDTVVEANGMLADVIAQAAQQVVLAINSQDFQVSIGDDVIAQSAARGAEAYYQRTGGKLI